MVDEVMSWQCWELWEGIYRWAAAHLCMCLVVPLWVVSAFGGTSMGYMCVWWHIYGIWTWLVAHSVGCLCVWWHIYGICAWLVAHLWVVGVFGGTPMVYVRGWWHIYGLKV